MAGTVELDTNSWLGTIENTCNCDETGVFTPPFKCFLNLRKLT